MSRIQTVIFDLDDTLYDEVDFVEAALRSVAEFVNRHTGMDVDELHEELLEVLHAQGRGKVFDTIVERHGLPASWVPSMVYAYRTTTPSLTLFPDAAPLLARLRVLGVSIAILTDGCALVQANKVRGLGLERETVIYTDALGDRAAKPSTSGYLVALDLLKAEPSTSAYVANDVRKDFVGPRALGMTGVLVTRRILGNLDQEPDEKHPHVIVDRLDEVATALGLDPE